MPNLSPYSLRLIQDQLNDDLVNLLKKYKQEAGVEIETLTFESDVIDGRKIDFVGATISLKGKRASEASSTE